MFCSAATPAHGQAAPDIRPQASEKHRGFTVRQSGDWTHYDRSDVDLSSAKWKVESFRGKRTSDGGCSTLFTASRPANARQVEGVEVAFNSVTCETRMATRELGESESVSRTDTHNQQRQGLDRSSSMGAHGEATGPEVKTRSALIATATRSAFTKSWFEDPSGIDVTYTEVGTTWTYGGGCVSGVSGWYNHSYFVPTGWWVIGGPSWNNSYTCSQSTSNLYAAYANELFCPGTGNLTYNIYNRTRVEGKADGSVFYAWPATKSGGCSSLLSQRYNLG